MYIFHRVYIWEFVPEVIQRGIFYTQRATNEQGNEKHWGITLKVHSLFQIYFIGFFRTEHQINRYKLGFYEINILHY